MRALELKTIFSNNRTGEQLEKYKKKDRERLINVRPYVDTRPPISLSQMRDAAKSPSKRVFRQQGTMMNQLTQCYHVPNNHLSKPPTYNAELKAATAKHNLALAKRIFQIMEGPGLVSTLLDPGNNKHLELHPGTINFNSRLEEAQRIHKENMLLASRLDTMQPYYKRSDFRVKITRPNQNANKKKKKQRAKFPGIDDGKTDRAKWKKNSGNNDDVVGTKNEPTQDHNPFKVLVETTKMQNGKLLDVAVIKEPFQDRFVIFGIDIDIGQRYELRLTSDEISSIVDGDILVTSLDNIEVWVMLLNKISLNPVDAFSKLPSGVFPKRSLEQRLEEKVGSGGSPPLEPRPPSSSRPVTSGKSSRAANLSANGRIYIDSGNDSSSGLGEGYETLIVNENVHMNELSEGEKEVHQVEDSTGDANKTSPFIPALKLSARSSEECGNLNMKSDNKQQKKASPIGKWDFAPAEEKIPQLKATSGKEGRVTGKTIHSARNSDVRKDRAYNTKVSLTARPPVEKKVTTKSRVSAYRNVEERIRGGAKGNNVSAKKTNDLSKNVSQNDAVRAKMSNIARGVVNAIISAAVKQQLDAQSLS